MQPIGVLRSPHVNPADTPIQPVFAQGVRGQVRLEAQYVEGLRDLAAFSHVFLFYIFDRMAETRLTVTPYLEDQTHGVFATRGPWRPNKLGFSLVRLLAVEDNILHIEDVDILDGTPIIDIKPYVERFDRRENTRSGWLDGVSEVDAVRRGQRGHSADP